MTQVTRNAKIGRTYMPASPQITSLQVRMAAQDISHWKAAIDNARNILMPRRRKLYELYDIIGLDGHLMSVMNKRRTSVTNQKVHFNIKGQDGVIDEKVRDLILETPWFYKLIGHLCESKPFGHSLVELIPANGLIGDVSLIPRANVKPETNFLMWDTNNEQVGFNYKEDPTYNKYMIEMGAPKDYGLLMVAAQYVIYKRGGFGDWAQFAELFGMPFREGQYDAWDEPGRTKLEEALSTMGGAGWVVTPKGTELKFHDNNGAGKSEVFKDLIEICNQEMSKIFLGNTMTTDNGSSRSQGEVHRDVERDINMGDLIEHEYLYNWTFKDKLRNIGYPIPDGRFFYPEMKDIPLESRIDMDLKLSDKIAIAEEYWYTMYGIPKPGTAPADANSVDDKPVPPAPDPKPGDKGEGKKKAQPVTAMLSYDHCDCGPLITAAGTEDITDEEEALITSIFEAKQGPYDPAILQMNINKLRDALFTHLAPSTEYGEPDHIASTFMEVNLNRFGIDKSLAINIELNKLLNQNKTFGQFKSEANKLLLQYNHRNLQTEYDMAISTAQNASAWNRQKQQGHLFPYLKYQTAGDSHVRAAHAALDGKLFSLKDSSWRGIYPPNGWNCRCEMVQVEKSEADENPDNIVNGPTAKGLLGKEWDAMVKQGFDKNRGDLNEIFDLNKAYVKSFGKKDVTDYGLNYLDINLQDISELAANAKASPKSILTTDVAKAKKLFDSKAKLYKDKPSVFYSDYIGRQIRLDKTHFEEHLSEEYTTAEENRQGLFAALEDILNNPTEVWFQQYKPTKYQYKFIKIYKDIAIVADARIETDGLEIKTWYLLKGENANELRMRSGYLIKN